MDEILEKVTQEIAQNHRKIIDDWCKAYLAELYESGVQIKPGSFTLVEQVPIYQKLNNCMVKKYWFESGTPKFEKDQPYWERNQLVAYLSKLLPAWLEKHPEKDLSWQDDWRNIVFIDFPEGKFSWHIHNSELIYFNHLNFKEGDSWDGSTTERKYESLRKSCNVHSYKGKRWVI